MKQQEVIVLLEPLRALMELFSLFESRGIIIGGVAASLLGKPRATADVDGLVLLDIESLPNFMKQAEKLGLFPRITDAADFAKKHRVLLLRHNASGINVDISLGLLPFETEAVERSQQIKIGNIVLKIPTPEDLIIFKAVAHRPQDMEDIKAVITNHEHLDIARIRRWVKDFADVLEMPEILDDVSRLLKLKYQNNP